MQELRGGATEQQAGSEQWGEGGHCSRQVQKIGWATAWAPPLPRCPIGNSWGQLEGYRVPGSVALV